MRLSSSDGFLNGPQTIRKSEQLCVALCSPNNAGDLLRDAQLWRGSRSKLLEDFLSLPKISCQIPSSRFSNVDGKASNCSYARSFVVDSKEG